ncbi:MAG: hypothetical protein OHK0037_27710 [Elainellaceae cyanobacterium]
MTQQNLSDLLVLVDEWVAQLREWELSEACKTSGRDFFTYMQGRGVYAGWMVKIVQQCTGHHPARLYTVEDAALLRDAISRYEYSQRLIAQNSNENPYSIIERQWSHDD